MKLHVNKEHLKANISSLLIASCVTAGVGGSYISFFNDSYNDEEKQYYFNEFTNVMYLFEDNIALVNDLDKVMNVKINADNDNKWINNCKNISNIEIIIRNEDISKLNFITNIPNLRQISIKSLRKNNDIIFNEESFSFLKKCNKLNKITFDNVQVDPEYLEKLTSLEIINFDKKSFYNCNCNFTKFPNLSYVNFGNLRTYTLGMFLNHESIEYFKNNNITIKSNKDSDLKTNLIEIDNRLEYQKNRLWDISNNSSDEEKLTSILRYLIYQFEYSEEYLNLNETERKDYRQNKLYKDGYLYGGLYNKGDIICGNYAAMFQALANRIGLESYFITSNDHAWNLVNIDESYYYTDATWLDENIGLSRYVFLNNTLNKLSNNSNVSFEWYLKDPKMYSDDIHISTYSPLNINIYLEEKNSNDFTKWKYKVQLFNGDTVILTYMSLTLLLITIWYLTIRDIKNRNIIEEHKKNR